MNRILGPRNYDLSSISRFRPFLIGIATLLVALYHSYMPFIGTDGNGLHHFLYLIEFDLYTIEKIGQIGVDIFLFLSAIGLYYSLQKNNDISSFYMRRLKRILPEFLFIASVYEIYKGRDIHQMIRNISGISFVKDGNLSYWFFYLILFLYGIYPFIYRIQMRFHRNVSLVLIVVFVVLNYCVSLGFPVFFSHVEIAMRRIPVFLLGSYFAEDVKKGKTVNEIPVILLSSLCLYLSYRFLLSDECSSSIFFRYVLGVNGVSLVFILSWIMNRIGDRIHIIKKAIEYVGLYSLEFYLIYEKLVLEMKSYLNDSFINALICFILCLIIAQLISKVNRKLFS